jgi:FKBP-type peptidyl-prolyl cis-trans isomerase 2
MTGLRKQQGITAILLGFFCLAHATHAEKLLPIADGSKVTLNYTVTLPDQTVVDSTVGKEPFSYIHGGHQMTPVALEQALTGLKAGDRKRITLAAAKAFGHYDEKKRVTVPIGSVPADTKVGSLLRSEEGLEARVIEVNADVVVLDTNHPLAGKNLVFDVNILKVEMPALTK